MFARSGPLRPSTAVDETLRSLGPGLIAPSLLTVGAGWIVLTIVGGGDRPVSVPWPFVAAILAATAVVVTVVVLVARREAAIVIERTAELADQTALTRYILDTASDAVVTLDRDGSIVEANIEAARMFGVDAAELLGKDALETIVASEHRVRVLARIRGLDDRSDGEPICPRAPAEMQRANGLAFSTELLITATGRGPARRIHLFAHDTSTQLAAERAVSEHVEDLAALLQVARQLSGSEAPHESRRAVCRAARELTEGEFVHVFEFDSDRNLLCLTASDGSGVDFMELPLTGRQSLVSDAFRSGESQFSGDMLVDERADREAARRVGLRAGCFQPIIRDGKTIGVLVVGWHRPIETLSPRVASLLALFATQVAAVLERADLIARLADLARTDSLTGLANRRALDEALERESSRADRTGQPLTVALVDMDHFKRFNDERGHQAGDWLLAETARAWRRELRPSDTLARFGGEEFVVVLPNSTSAAAVRAIERLRRAVPADQTCSAGIATRLPGESTDALLKRADEAMYVAKRGGRDRSALAPAGRTNIPSAHGRRRPRAAGDGSRQDEADRPGPGSAQIRVR